MQFADSDQEFPEKVFSNNTDSKDEKFELLSAYLDGEVTEAEYQLVVGWIASDREWAQQYQQQLKLRQALQSLKPTFLASANPSKYLFSDRTSDHQPQQNQFSRQAYAPYSLLESNPPTDHSQMANQLNFTMCNLALPRAKWRQGLIVLAVLGATAVTMSTGMLTNRRRPINLDESRESLSGHIPQKFITASRHQHALSSFAR